MIYAEHNYLLEMFIFPDVTKEEAFQIAEGVSITPTEETSGENVMQVCSWNDMENEAGKGEPETDESETLMTFPKEKMKIYTSLAVRFLWIRTELKQHRDLQQSFPM